MTKRLIRPTIDVSVRNRFDAVTCGLSGGMLPFDDSLSFEAEAIDTVSGKRATARAGSQEEAKFLAIERLIEEE